MPSHNVSVDSHRLIFWAALALISLASLLSLLSNQRVTTLADRVEQSQNVLVEVNRLVSALKDVETGARGYLITHDRRFLQPFEAGPVQFQQTHQRLRQLVEGDAASLRKVDRLRELGQERIRLAGEVVASPFTSDPPPVTRRYIEAGRATMDEIRGEADAIIEAERRTYAERQRAVARQANITNLIIATAVALSLAALAWLFIVRSREASRLRAAEDELRSLNADLELRVQERTHEVERSRELLNAVIENMPDTVFLKDANDDCRYILVNGAGEKLFGRSRRELVGRIDHELFPREQAELCRQEDMEVAACGRERRIPERALTTDQGVRYVESRKVPISDPFGDHCLVLGIIRDITEQKALSDQVRQMQRIDAVGKLTGGIAHDFNNLLGVIIGNVELLRQDAKDGTETAEMADEAIGAANRGAELVRRMLAFARMQHLEPAVVDLNERLPDIVALLRRALGESIRVEVRPADQLWQALVDPTQVDDALLNLAINARDAMPGGGSLCIETANVHLDEDYATHHAEVVPGEYVMLAVSDSGTGMSREVIARAFEPFYTTKETGSGTGLGLSQVYGWVKQSGGHIKIYSELGHGTTIRLYLPRAVGDQDQLSRSSQPSGDTRGRETILVVEDNPHVRRTVMRQLRNLGYTSIEAEDGASALEVVRSGTAFDLLLTDVVMPGGMTGYDLAARVKEIRPGQRILFTSGYTELATSQNGAFEVGPFLSKPYRKEDLGRAIRAVLDE